MSYEDKLKQIDTLQQKINLFGELNADVKKRINYKFRLDWNYYSNSMEGNTLTMDETRSVMVGNLTVGSKPIKDVLEMKGHDEVISEILKIGKGEVRLSESRIREIHNGIMHEEDAEKKNKIGGWKTEPNYILNYKGEKFEFALPAEVPAKMHDLLNKTNAALDAIIQNKKDAPHPVTIALQFHLDYVTIHPFYDGNGRTARILTNLLLISLGYPPFWIKVDERKIYNQYIADIQGYGGDNSLFFDFAAGLIIRSQQIVLDAIEGKNIGEDDDLSKEISIWKKYATSNKIGSIHRSDELVYEIYTNGLKEMLEQFNDELKEFYDVFYKTTMFTYINNSGREGTNWLNDEMNRKMKSQLLDVSKPPQTIQTQDTFTNIFIAVNFHEYKYNDRNPFSLNPTLKFDFEPYKYKVSYPGKIIVKNYGEFLSADERKQIITDSIKRVFDEIKGKSEIK